MARLDRRITPAMDPRAMDREAPMRRSGPYGSVYAPSWQVQPGGDGRITPATTHLAGDSRIAAAVPLPVGRQPMPHPATGPDERDCITVTTPVRVTAIGAQELRLAIDVSAYDVIDLALRVLRLEGTGPSVTVEIQTGMQAESTEGWVTVVAYPAVSTAPKTELKNFVNLLRYIRWNVTVLSGSGGPAATFMIDGTARRWA